MSETITQLIGSNLLQIILTLVLIVVLAIIALYLVNVTSHAIDKRIISTTEDLDRRARLLTLRKAIKSTLQMVILTVAVLIGLSTVGIDIGPALAAVGILGLAVSLGAQTIIKDVIGGITILLEDQFRVGDFVKIGTVSGDVEGITLRRTDLRDAEGRLYMIPNGDVRIVANETRDWARALVELSFSFDADQKKSISALENALTRLSADQSIKPYLLSEPEIFGWNAFNEWAVIVKLSVKVTAGKRDQVVRVMRQYALEALSEAGVPTESYSKK